jgi:AraC-like DNA-binding protein
MFSIFAPLPVLAPFIECYWQREPQAAADAIQAATLPVDGRADLMFTFGQRYEVLVASGERKQSHNVAHLNAQRGFPLAVAQDPQVPLIGVRFRPGGLSAFLPIPAGELSNLSLEIKALFGPASTDLEDQLFDHLYDSLAQIAGLNDFFLKRLAVQPGYHAARAAALQIEATRGRIRVEQLSQELGYSARTIDRLFAQIFGYTPKFYARIIRFHHALDMLKTQRFDLTTVAFQSGYYDQSHFIKDFGQFAGTTPQQHLERLQLDRAQGVYRVRFLQSEADTQPYTLQSSRSSG